MGLVGARGGMVVIVVGIYIWLEKNLAHRLLGFSLGRCGGDYALFVFGWVDICIYAICLRLCCRCRCSSYYPYNVYSAGICSRGIWISGY
jgi:hypothetical protein